MNTERKIERINNCQEMSKIRKKINESKLKIILIGQIKTEKLSIEMRSRKAKKEKWDIYVKE